MHVFLKDNANGQKPESIAKTFAKYLGHAHDSTEHILFWPCSDTVLCFVWGCIHSLFVSKVLTRSYLGRSGFWHKQLVNKTPYAALSMT